jgi:hypothetical protein
MAMLPCCHRYQAENSIAQRETGFTKRSQGRDILVKKGFYSFVSPEGEGFRVDYQADEDGFRAVGRHLPQQDGGIHRASALLTILHPHENTQ